MSSLDDLDPILNQTVAAVIEKIDEKIEDIGTDIYHASLPARSTSERE